MNAPLRTERDYEELSSRLLDVLIRAGMILVIVLLCYRVFSPFLTLMVWALILAVAIYPLHQSLARRMGGKQGLTATVITIIGSIVIVVPSALLLSSLGDSVQSFVHSVQNHTLQVPPPRPGVAEWPLVGQKIHGWWSRAYTDLPGFVQGLEP